MTLLDVLLILAGIAVTAAGVWLFRYAGRLADRNTRWVKNGFVANLFVFLILGAWCGGLGMIAYGLGLGGTP